MGVIVATAVSAVVACSAAATEIVPVSLTAGALPSATAITDDAPDAASTGGDDGAVSNAPSTQTELKTTGTQRVWVSIVSATATTSDDVNAVTASDAAALVASMNAYWSRESGVAISLALAGVETRSIGASSCDSSSLFSSVPQTAFSGRFASERWRGTADHLLILTTESCGQAGLGSVGGDGGVMLSGDGTGSLGVPVAIHEFGHTIGFGHAGASMCRSTDTLDGSTADYGDASSLCPTDEYGDYLDIMGYSIDGATPGLSSAQRIRQGWLTDFTNVTSASGSVTATLSPLESGSGDRAIRITDPLSGAVYYIEYRTPTGEDASSTEFRSTESCATTSGWSRCSRGVSGGEVRILRELPYRGYSTYVRTTVIAAGAVDGDPSSRTTGLGTGATFASANGGFYVRVNSAGGATASVTVRFTPPASTTASLSATGSERYGATTTVTARISSADGSTPSGTVAVLDGSKTITTATVSQGSTRVTLPRLAVGTHSLSVRFTPATGDALASTSARTKVVVAKAKSTVSATVTHTRVH